MPTATVHTCCKGMNLKTVALSERVGKKTVKKSIYLCYIYMNYRCKLIYSDMSLPKYTQKFRGVYTLWKEFLADR